jgi:hypothetical protein
VEKLPWRGITIGSLWTSKRILKRCREALARPCAEAVEILSPPRSGRPSGETLRSAESLGNQDLGASRQRKWCGEAERGRPRNRLVSGLPVGLRAPASHTCRGPECIVGRPVSRWSNLHLATGRNARMKHSITDFWSPNGLLAIVSERILKFFLETSCGGDPEGCRNSFTATQDPRSGSNPGSGASRRQRPPVPGSERR